jgi:carboxypeptidase C (cathepsin A)
MRQVLGYQTTLIYRPTTNVFAQWDWKHNGALPTNTAQDLANAMAFNPNLRIFSANGYYDFATPFYATVYTLNHLTVPQQLEQNISYGFYESGHMVYLHTPALSQFHDDLERWYAQTLQAGR